MLRVVLLFRVRCWWYNYSLDPEEWFAQSVGRVGGENEERTIYLDREGFGFFDRGGLPAVYTILIPLRSLVDSFRRDVTRDAVFSGCSLEREVVGYIQIDNAYGTREGSRAPREGNGRTGQGESAVQQ